MSNIYRLVYTDSNSNQQVLAVQGTGKNDVPNSDNADYSIRNARLDRELRNINRLKIWAESDMLGSVPLGFSEFEADEPEIFWQKYDESSSEWVNEFRGYAENKGSIDDEGEFTVKLYSFAKYTGAKEATVSVSNSDIGAIVSAAAGSNYTVDVPSDVSAPVISQYDFSDKAENLYQEITRNYGYNIAFTPNTDGNGDYIIRLEPVGYGGIAGTVAGKEDTESNPDALRGMFKEWEKERTSDIVNKVKVVGTDSNNIKVSETVVDQASIDEYGGRTKNITVDWVLEGSSEAQDIGNGRLSPDPTEGGKVRVSRIDGDATNFSYEVIDSRRNISGSFTAVQQTNFYPENTTYLRFEYESKVEEEVQIRKNVNEERAALISDSLKNIGGVDFTGQTGGDTSNAERDPNDNGITIGTENGQNINVVDERRDSFDTTIPNSETSIAESNDVDGNWTPMTLDALYHVVGFAFYQDGTNGKSIRVAIDAYPDEGDGTPDVLNYRSIFVDKMDNTGASGFSQGGLGFPDASWIKQITIGVRGQNYGGAEPFYGLRAIGSGVTSTAINGSFYAYAITHSHPIADDDISVIDSIQHSDHGTSGSTNDIEGEFAEEDKTNR